MTIPTSNPVPSASPVDLLFNAEKMDQVINSAIDVYVDRLGRSRMTLSGAVNTIKLPSNRGAWATATLYAVRDLVLSGGTWYICVSEHTAGATFAADSAARWRVFQGVTTADLSSNSAGVGAALVGTTAGITLHQLLQPMPAAHTDGTNTITGSGRVFLGNKSPSTDDSAILIGRNLVGSYNTGAHAVRDESSWNYSGAGLGGYASFDSLVTVTGSQTYDHLTAYQARPQYVGTGVMGRLAGYTCQVSNTGSGTVFDAMSIKIDDVAGVGPVTNNYGIYISALSRGTGANYAIYSGGTAQSYHGGAVTVGSEVVAQDFNAYGTPASFRAAGGMLMAYNTSGQGVLRAYSNSAGAAGTIAFTGPSGQFAQFDVNGYLLCGFTGSNGAYRLQVNSQIYATSAVVATSDKRYKTAVEPIRGALGLVMNLEPVSFDWKKHPVHEFPAGRAVGFLAQDVAAVLAGSGYAQAIVKSNSTEMPDGSTEEFFGLAEAGLVPLLTSALQETVAALAKLTERVAALESGRVG